MSNRCPFWFASLGILLYPPTHCSADQADLLSLVRAGHRAARESIHSFSANVTSEIIFPKQPKIVLTGHYWRSLNVIRIQEKQSKGTEDYLVENSEIRQVGRDTDSGSGQIRYAASRRAAMEILSVLDVWSLMMIDFVGLNKGRFDFDRAVEFAKEPPKTNLEKKDGHNCVRVDLSYVSGGEQNVTLWHDVDRNYLIWKKTISPKNSSTSFDSEIIEFAEPLPGVFVPVKCRRQTSRGGERENLEIVALTDIQVNKPIPKSVFQLPAIPSGTILEDRIQRTRYPIDASWRPLGPSRPLPQAAKSANSDGLASDYHSQSSTEPTPFSRWLILTSLFVLIVAFTCLLYRRLRLGRRLQRPN